MHFCTAKHRFLTLHFWCIFQEISYYTDTCFLTDFDKSVFKVPKKCKSHRSAFPQVSESLRENVFEHCGKHLQSQTVSIQHTLSASPLKLIHFYHYKIKPGTYYTRHICRPVILQSQHSIKDICNQAFLMTVVAKDLKATKLGAACRVKGAG